MENNIISLFNRRPVQEKDTASPQVVRSSAQVAAPASDSPEIPGDFAAIAERNRQLQEKLRKEREQANKAVLKSYRIK